MEFSEINDQWVHKIEKKQTLWNVFSIFAVKYFFSKRTVK